MTSKAQIAANVRYNRSKDAITIRPDKETGRSIRSAAAEAGLPLQRYIIQAIQERMERDRGNIEDQTAGD